MGSVYSVSQVNTYIKNMFTQDFALNRICIKGEVSNCKYHTSGHIYFTLKDKGGVISAVMFAGNRGGLSFKLEEGQNVIATGSVSIYERDGKYQLYAKEITLEGEGLLYQRFEQLKQELSEMGMFDEMYKKPIPSYALKVGICTASTGAAIQDIINISTRRNPYVQLYLYPAIVQGANAAPSIINGIRCLDGMHLDVIIIGRGGGSIEDLWAFNEESVARAIFECNTPIISAVGHETDVTIADFVADRRVPTPSAAAEVAVFDFWDFKERLDSMVGRLRKILLNKTDITKMKIQNYEDKLKYLSPTNQIRTKRQYADDILERMQILLYNKLKDRQHRLAMIAEKLNGLSPLNKISKGYAYVVNDNNEQIKSIGQVDKGTALKLTVNDGMIHACVTKIEKGSIDNGK